MNVNMKRELIVIWCLGLSFLCLIIASLGASSRAYTNIQAEAENCEVTVNGEKRTVYTVVDSVTGKTTRYILTGSYPIILPEKAP